MTCNWCETPIPAASEKDFCSIHCANKWAWYGGIRPDEVTRRARAERLRRRQREDVEAEQAQAQAQDAA